MNFNALVQAMTPETYEKLAQAVATKRWEDGNLLSEAQLAHSLQLVMAYQAVVLKSEELFTIGADGQMIQKTKSEIQKQNETQSSIARFSHDDL
ncbi:YeaC family protein [Rheinheimera sp. WS51]|uniref:YeaC family protein n=1 Tax=Rheinheimera sp. WS51 TaxID=3425886 RepID=UPI003D89CE2A